MNYQALSKTEIYPYSQCLPHKNNNEEWLVWWTTRIYTKLCGINYLLYCSVECNLPCSLTKFCQRRINTQHRVTRGILFIDCDVSKTCKRYQFKYGNVPSKGGGLKTSVKNSMLIVHDVPMTDISVSVSRSNLVKRSENKASYQFHVFIHHMHWMKYLMIKWNYSYCSIRLYSYIECRCCRHTITDFWWG